MEELLRVVVGLGRAGVGIHIKLLSENNKYKIIGVYDQNIKKAVRFSMDMKCHCYQNVHDIASDSRVDLVVIATPSKFHYDIALEMMSSRKHVVIEKPIASSIEEIRDIDSLSKKMKCYAVPFFNFRFVPEFIIIQELIDEGLIGNIHLIKRTVSYYNRRKDWQSKKSENGGIMNAAAVHHLDQILQLTKIKPYQIFSDVRRIVSSGDAPDHCKVMMKFDNNIVVDLEVSWAEKSLPIPWVIYGERGVIQQVDNKLECEWFTEEDVSEIDDNEMSYLSNEDIKWNKKIFNLSKDYSAGLTPLFYQYLSDALDGRREIPVKIDSIMNTMSVMQSIK